MKASTLAEVIDSSFVAYFYLSILILVILTAAGILFLRGSLTDQPENSKSATSNQFLGAILISAALLISSVIFITGLRGFAFSHVAPNDAIIIEAVVHNHEWSFKYIEGAVTDTLVVPQNQPVKILMNARDAVYDLLISSFRVAKSVIPYRYSSIWFEPVIPGEYEMLSTRHGVDGNTTISHQVKVLSIDDYQDWIGEKSDPSIGKTPEQYGEIVLKQSGCAACHSVDGSTILAPTLKGIFGSVRELASGDTLTADEEYLQRALKDPKAEVSKGFDPVMQAYDMKDKELNALIAYIKSLK